MKATSEWIKADYRTQTVLGIALGCLIAGSALICLYSIGYGFLGGYLAVLFLMPIGAWQVISGLVYAFKGDRLQQIYLGVVAVFFGIWFAMANLRRDYFIIMMLIAVVIAVWKYTVVRADYISLKIIDVPNIEDENLLDV